MNFTVRISKLLALGAVLSVMSAFPSWAKECLKNATLPDGRKISSPAAPGQDSPSTVEIEGIQYPISCVRKVRGKLQIQVIDEIGDKKSKARILSDNEVSGATYYSATGGGLMTEECIPYAKLPDGRTVSASKTYFSQKDKTYWITCIRPGPEGSPVFRTGRTDDAGNAETKEMKVDELSDRTLWTEGDDGKVTSEEAKKINPESFAGDTGSPISCPGFEGNKTSDKSSPCNGSYPYQATTPTLCHYNNVGNAIDRINQQKKTQFGGRAGQINTYVVTIPRGWKNNPSTGVREVTALDWVNVNMDKSSGRIIGYEVHSGNKNGGGKGKSFASDPRIDMDSWNANGSLPRFNPSAETERAGAEFDERLDEMLDRAGIGACPFVQEHKKQLRHWQDPKEEIVDHFVDSRCGDFVAGKQICCDASGQKSLADGSCPVAVLGGAGDFASDALKITNHLKSSAENNADFNRSMINTSRRGLLVQQIAIMGSYPLEGGVDYPIGPRKSGAGCAEHEADFKKEVEGARNELSAPSVLSSRKESEAKSNKQLVMDTIQMAFENCRKRGGSAVSDAETNGTIAAIKARNPVVHALDAKGTAEYFTSFYQAFSKNVPNFSFDTKYITGREPGWTHGFEEWCEFTAGKTYPGDVRDGMLAAVAKLPSDHAIFKNAEVSKTARTMKKEALDKVAGELDKFTKMCGESDEWFRKDFWSSDEGLSLWRNKGLLRSTLKDYIDRGANISDLDRLKEVMCKNEKALRDGEERAEYWRAGIDVAITVASTVTVGGALVGTTSKTVSMAARGARLAKVGMAAGTLIGAASVYAGVSDTIDAYNSKETARGLLFAGVGTMADYDEAAKEYSEALSGAIMNTGLFLAFETGNVIAFTRALKASRNSWKNVLKEYPEAKALVRRFEGMVADGSIDKEMLGDYMKAVQQECRPSSAVCILKKMEDLTRDAEGFAAWKAASLTKGGKPTYQGYKDARDRVEDLAFARDSKGAIDFDGIPDSELESVSAAVKIAEEPTELIGRASTGAGDAAAGLKPGGVFEVPGDKNKVVKYFGDFTVNAIGGTASADRAITREMLQAKELHRLGVGPKVYGTARLPNGKLGIVMDKVPGKYMIGAGKSINGQTFKDVDRIFATLEKNGYGAAGDFQIMVTPEGRAVVIDATSLVPASACQGGHRCTTLAEFKKKLKVYRDMP